QSGGGFKPLNRSLVVQTAGGIVFVEEAAASGVDEVAPVRPPRVHAKAGDVFAEVADCFSGFDKAIPRPVFTTGVVQTGFVEQVGIVVDGESGHVTRQTPQRLCAFFDRRRQKAHRTCVEVVGAVFRVGSGEIGEVED